MKKETLNFEKMGGLIPVVIQDYQNLEVLMVGFMNKEAWELTCKTKKVHYWSRKKKRIWMKGEESGHFQIVKEILLDNDNDSLLIKVFQIGGAVEDGYRSCFYKKYSKNKFVVIGDKIFNPKKVYKNYSDKIIFAIPSGSVYASTIMLLGLSGYQLELRGDRCFKPSIRNNKNIKIVIARAEEIPHMIENEQVDIGLTGIDLIKESQVSVTNLVNLKYNEGGIGEVNWVLSVPKENFSDYKSLKDFENKNISTELVNVTKEYFLKNKINVFVQKSIGSTEGKAPFFADAIVDLCETGKSLRDNGLVPLYKILTSTIHLFANNHSLAYGWKRKQIEEIVEKLKNGMKKLPKNSKKFIKLPNKYA